MSTITDAYNETQELFDRITDEQWSKIKHTRGRLIMYYRVRLMYEANKEKYEGTNLALAGPDAIEQEAFADLPGTLGVGVVATLEDSTEEILADLPNVLAEVRKVVG